MKLKSPITLAKAAQILDCEFAGSAEHIISGFNEIHVVESGDLTFVDVEKYYDKALNSAATTILIDKKVTIPEGKGLLISDVPFRDYNILTEHFRPRKPLDTAATPVRGKDSRIHSTATFGEDVTIGDEVEIGAFVSIGSHVRIGKGSRIKAGAVIGDYVLIGEDCRIASGAVVGGDAFYYKSQPHRKDPLLTKGRIILEDHVDIGANSTIDRGVSGDTKIGAWTKLDNLVQIGHDTQIGKRCIIAAQVGVAGCVVVEDDVILWGQVGVNKDLRIGKGAELLGKTGVMSSLEGGKTYLGMIAHDARERLREEVAMRQLPGVMRKIKNLLK